MRCVFAEVNYQGDISNWDLSAVTYSDHSFTRFNDNPLYYMELISGRSRPSEQLKDQVAQLLPLVMSLNMPLLDAANWMMQQLRNKAPSLEDTFEVPTDLMVK
jgi:hypothetical protein